MSFDSSQYLRKLYDGTSSRLRWQIIALVAATYLFVGKNIGAVTAILIVASAYNAFTYTAWAARHDVIGTKWFDITTNFTLIALLVLCTGGLASPYGPLVLVIILVASYWYGYTGLGYVMALLLAYWALMLFQNPIYDLSHAIFGVFSIILGDYTVRLGKLTRSEQERIDRDTNALMQQRKRLFSLVNGLSQAIFVVDKDGKIIVYNGAALELLDTHYEIERLPAVEVVHLCDEAGSQVFPIQHSLSSGEMFASSDLKLKVNETTTLDVYTSITPMVEEGERVGALLLLRDISEQKTLDSQKDEFISIISHELRTPVAIVEADLSTLMLPKFAQLPEHASKLLNNAYQNLTFLASLLKDLSNLASSERSLLETELAPLDPVSFCHAMIDGIRPKAEEQGLKLKFTHSTGLKKVTTSPQRVEEILMNFMTNALKYSSRKNSIVELRISPSKMYQGGVCFSVSDSGIGMKKKDQAQLFTKFFRSENPQAQAVKGTGMGLYISKKQADKIGATISLESTFGKGSVFSLDVPRDVKKA
jgi:signal transduction histidine kinase